MLESLNLKKDKLKSLENQIKLVKKGGKGAKLDEKLPKTVE